MFGDKKYHIFAIRYFVKIKILIMLWCKFNKCLYTLYREIQRPNLLSPCISMCSIFYMVGVPAFAKNADVDTQNMGNKGVRDRNNFVETIYQVGHPLGTSSATRNYMVKDFSQQFQVVLAHQYNETDYGEYINGEYYPIAGVNISFGDFGHVRLRDSKRPELGESSFGQFYSVSFHFSKYIHVRNNTRIKYVIENGISYSSNPYNTKKNYYSSIGGHLQQYFGYGLFLSYYYKSCEYSIGPQFTHHSNSGAYRPNSGINNIALSFRMKVDADYDVPRCTRGFENSSYIPFFFHNICVSYGGHVFNEQQYDRQERIEQWIDAGCPQGSEWDFATSDKYTIYGNLNMSYEFMYRTNPRYAYGIGLDGFYTFGTDYIKKYYETHDCENLRKVRNFYLGSAFRSEIYVKNFAINLHIGYYLNDKHISGPSSYTRFYERIGMKYYLPEFGNSRYESNLKNSRLFLGYFIKGNLLNAEQFEVCLGYSL